MTYDSDKAKICLHLYGMSKEDLATKIDSVKKKLLEGYDSDYDVGWDIEEL